jgi:hypothetical protein
VSTAPSRARAGPNRRRTALAIAAIWILVLVAAFVLVALFADDNPSTDEGAGAGALAAIVGALLTALYLALSRKPSQAQVTDALGAVGLFVAGVALAAAVGAADGALIFGGVLAGLYLWARHRRRPRTPMPPPAPGRRCPACNQVFRADASECPHCGAESEPWIWHSDAWWARSREGAWQWLDEAAGTWRWYEDGTPSGSGETSPQAEESPSVPEPPSGDPTSA